MTRKDISQRHIQRMERVREMAALGMHDSEIAKELSVEACTVHKIRWKYRIPSVHRRGGKARWTHDRYPQMREWAGRLSWIEIAFRLGLNSPASVQYVLKVMGIKGRGGGNAGYTSPEARAHFSAQKKPVQSERLNRQLELLQRISFLRRTA